MAPLSFELIKGQTPILEGHIENRLLDKKAEESEMGQRTGLPGQGK